MDEIVGVQGAESINAEQLLRFLHQQRDFRSNEILHPERVKEICFSFGRMLICDSLI